MTESEFREMNRRVAFLAALQSEFFLMATKGKKARQDLIERVLLVGTVLGARDLAEPIIAALKSRSSKPASPRAVAAAFGYDMATQFGRKDRAQD